MVSTVSDARRNARARLLGVVATIALLVGVLWVGRVPLLRGLGSLLIVDDPLRPADLIYVLNGELETRPSHAAALFRAGLGQSILIARVGDSPPAKLGLIPNETDVAVEVLRHEGVPAAGILVLGTPGGVTSTFDEARALRLFLESHPARRVILVTSAFHTRRARWIVARELAGSGVTLSVSSAPHYAFRPEAWWEHEEGLLAFVEELVKWPYYLLTYR